MAYPPSIPPANRTDDTTSAGNHASDHNALANGLGDVVTELGPNPSGSEATVQARIAAEETARAAADTALDGRLDAIEGLGSLATDAELAAGLATKANTAHTHAIADVTALQAALDAKQDAATAATDTELAAEATARQNADTALDGRLDTLEAVDNATQAELDAHIGDTTAAHAASAISFTPTGSVAATTVQAAIAEVASEGSSTTTLTARTITTGETLVLSDAGCVVEVNAAGTVDVTVPPNSTVAFPVGSVVEVDKLGAGTVNLKRGSGVTFAPTNSDFSIAADAVSLRKRATDEWFVIGERGAYVPTTSDPSTLSGLSAWYQAEDIAQADASAVSAWADKSGNGRNLAQATSGNQPTYRTSVLNSKPVVRFDGSNDFLAATVPQGASQVTIFAVSKLTATSSTPMIATWNNFPELRYSGTTTSAEFKGSANSATITTAAGFHVICGDFDTATDTSRIFLDGSTATASNTSDVGAMGTTTAFTLGARTGAVNPLNGDIAEIVVYNRKLTDTERNQVFAYLGTRYAITIT